VPSLDIFGHRLPNHFVDRSGADTEGELARLQQLAAEMGPDEGLVIFPEGTRFSAEKRERAINRVERTDPVLAARMRRLRHVMPPRAGGTAALLAGAPDADLVLFLHHGMEGLREVRDVVALVPLDRPITITARRIPRSEVDEENLGDWLLDLWEGVDTWVQEQYELSEDELTQAGVTQAGVTQAAVTQAASPQGESRQDGAGHAASPLTPPSVTDG
jgi:1-acyl-sn-glycerol-3-phosphate acyltransferase